MGYYTNFGLRICAKENGQLLPFFKMEEERLNRLKRCIEEMDVFDSESWDTGSEGVYAELYGYEKWYHWEEDMSVLSKEFPEVVFVLTGSGEDSEDHWMAYFYKGLEQYTRGVIQYDEFCEDKLKPY